MTMENQSKIPHCHPHRDGLVVAESHLCYRVVEKKQGSSDAMMVNHCSTIPGRHDVHDGFVIAEACLRYRKFEGLA